MTEIEEIANDESSIDDEIVSDELFFDNNVHSDDDCNEDLEDDDCGAWAP